MSEKTRGRVRSVILASGLTLLLLALAATLASSPVHAVDAPDPAAPPALPLPLGGVSVPEIVGRVIQSVLGLAGVIALVMFIYGGVSWMTAQGNTEAVGKAKKTLAWAAIGLALIFASYAIATAVINTLTKDLGPPGFDFSGADTSDINFDAELQGQ